MKTQLAVAAVAVLLTACASIDRNSALALGQAGQSAAQALNDQSVAARKTLDVLPEWWGVHDALECVNVAPALRKGCLDNVRGAVEATQPDDPLLASQKTLSALMAKRAAAATALLDAYQAFTNLATYDAAAETDASLKGAFGAINDLSRAASAFTPVPLPVITSGFTSALSGLGAVVASERQKKLLLSASKDLHAATDALIKALLVEKDKAASEALLAELGHERDLLYAAFVQSGLISPRDALAPLVNDAMPGAQIAVTLTDANHDAVITAATISLRRRSARQQEAIVHTYDAALAALAALSAQHAMLESGRPLNLSTLLAEARSIKATLDDMKQNR